MKTLNPQKSSPPDQILRILGCRVDRTALPEILERVREFISEGSSHQLITANTLMFLAAERDPELQSIIEHASLVIPESWGIAWASRRLGNPLPRFTPGIDLLSALCRWAAQNHRSIYLLGAKPGIAEKAAQTLVSIFPGLSIVGSRHGYFSVGEELQVIATIRQAAPAILFVGMSVPGQEKWIAHHLSALDVPVVMGVGGSFDVLSGRLRRAPTWMRNAGMEWLYRLKQEPWRWRRIAQLPVFAWKVFTETRKLKTQNSNLKNA